MSQLLNDAPFNSLPCIYPRARVGIWEKGLARGWGIWSKKIAGGGRGTTFMLKNCLNMHFLVKNRLCNEKLNCEKIERCMSRFEAGDSI